MLFMPFQVLGVWLRGLLSLALLIAGGVLLYQGYAGLRDARDARAADQSERLATINDGAALPSAEHNDVRTAALGVRRSSWDRRQIAYLIAGAGLMCWSLGGGLVPMLLLRRCGDAPPQSIRGTSYRLQRPDGTTLYAEVLGPTDGVPLILTHGWGLDLNEWCYLKKRLAAEYRLIVWDLPGLGQSTPPATNDWSLDKLAGDLEAVVELAGGKPAILVGHSIGGMIVLTYCRHFPQDLGERVMGLVLAQTTYTNPVKTTSMAALYTALQKPVLEPLCHLMIWLSPVVWVLNWLSYWNGSAHRSTERSSFSGEETRHQLKFITRYYVAAWPAVVARGMLGMFRYDASDVLASIAVPTLVVAGDDDTTCKPEASDTLAASIARAELVKLDKAKHCGLFEHHDRFESVLAGFVSKCVGSARSPLGPPHSLHGAPQVAGTHD